MIVRPGPNDFYKVTRLTKELIDWLKTEVPDIYRYCEGFNWCVHEKYLYDLIQLAYAVDKFPVDYSDLPPQKQFEIAEKKAHWRKTNHKSAPWEKKKEEGTLVDAYATLHLLPSAPLAIVEAVWRQLAKIHHPDHGGDAEQFKKLNEAYTWIRQRRSQ